MEQQSNRGGVLAVMSDLIFETKIRATARSMGIEVDVVNNPSSAVGAAKRRSPSLVIIDLNSSGPGIAAWLAPLVKMSGLHVVAYVSHVDEDLAREAREAGAHEVMARSRFNQMLPELLQKHGGSVVAPDAAI